jgi:hypothetical protein
MVSWMHSVTVGMAGDSESSPAGMIGVVGTVGQTATRERWASLPRVQGP